MQNKIKKLRLIVILYVIFLVACNFYGDLKLGSDFYYQTEPSFNSIVVPDNKKEPYSIQSIAIRNVELLGFNRKYILVTSKRNDSTLFWIIDKRKKTMELGYDTDSNIKLSNVNQIDSMNFYNLCTKEKIELKSKLFYQKEAGWN
jgi:hypothetical protein